MKMTLTFKHPDRSLSLNGQVPLTKNGAIICNLKKVALKRATRQEACVKAKELLKQEKLTTFDAVEYEIDWSYKGRTPDIDNVICRVKHLIDGCCDAFKIDDRQLELGRVRRLHSLKNAGNVTITFNDKNSCKFLYHF